MLTRGLTIFALFATCIIACTFILGANSSSNLANIQTHTITRSDLLVTVTEQGTLDSYNNVEIKCKVRGNNIITSVIESGTQVKKNKILLELDTLLIDEEISERTKYFHLANSTAARSKADMEKAELAISEYLEGRYISELATLEKNLAIAESKIATAKNILQHSKMMVEGGYASELDIEEKEFAVLKANMNVDLTNTKIEVLKDFTKKEELVTLVSALNVAKATYEADRERAYADELRLRRAETEWDFCTIQAPRDGMVIYPNAEEWEDAPDIEEGATVHKDQILLLMPDLTKMKVNVGIHESIIDRVRLGLPVRVTLPGKRISESDLSIDAEITSVASVAKPAGWWTGNVVKYDTMIHLPETKGLKPGMSVEVEVIIARHKNVLTIPTSAVIETRKGHACWVQNGSAVVRRALELGDRSDMFMEVKSGLAEGDKVVLDPLANVPEAQNEAAATLERNKRKSPLYLEGEG